MAFFFVIKNGKNIVSRESRGIGYRNKKYKNFLILRKIEILINILDLQKIKIIL